MDLLSARTSSNYTAACADAEPNGGDQQDKELSAYYSQVIRNSKTAKAKQAQRYQVRLDENCNKTQPSYSSPARNNNIALHIDDSHETNPRSATNRKLSMIIPKSIHNIETQVNSNHSNCFTKLPKVEVEPKLTFVKSNNKYEYHNTDQNITGPAHAEKTTYCRPAIDMYSQELIYKTMARNARLKDLVRRLVLARAREKQKVAWNNYINDLKNKHRYNNSEPRTIPNYLTEDTIPDTIDDYYRTRFTWKQSNPCQNLLEDFYSASNEMDLEYYRAPRADRPIDFRPYIFDNSKYCYPTASQGRLMMLNHERPKYKLANQSHSRTASRYHGIPIFVDKEDDFPSTTTRNLNSKRTRSNKQLISNKQNAIKSLSVQTDFDTYEACTSNENSIVETFRDKYNRLTSNVERLKQKVTQSQNEVKYCALSNIENKLDVLIHSINTFMGEIKSQKDSIDTKSEAKSCQFSNVNNLINLTKSDSVGTLRREQIICGMVQERPKSTLAFNDRKRRETIDDILYEEMHKSNKVKRDIEEILSKPNREKTSVHITFDIPTKERATEITDSLYKTRRSEVVVEEIGIQDDRRITIAVNTDPLGLLALFRVSAETVKQILSYMPQIDYYSYLSRLPLPQMSKNDVSHYVCNICGAAFGRSSQLSDHIHQHNLGNVRDCCVCRHVLDTQQHRAGLFSCQHCGQRFTRAYCRQLHEQICARSLGRSTDVTSSLMQLR